MPFATHAFGATLGLAALAGTKQITRGVPAESRTAVAAAGLTFAAAVYPLARRRWHVDAAPAREVGALLGFGAFSVAAARSAPPTARRALAAAWASHAIFDAVHESGPDSRIPDWYPAACAVYDLAVAMDLLR